jgi:hypothetical protein
VIGLDMRGCTVTLRAGNERNMLTTYAVANPAAAGVDGAATSGSNVVTTALAAQVVVGQTIWVKDPGANGYGPLIGNITAKTSTTVTIDNSPAVLRTRRRP